MPDVEAPTIYTIGHSIHPIETFIGLLERHEIETVADVRSKPGSRYNPQFNQSPLGISLSTASIGYIHFGELGGYPDDRKYYDTGGRALYERIAAEESFKKGIKRLDSIVDETRVAVMCAQWKPEDCHRHHLVARCLSERGLTVLHILRDGEVRDATEMFEAEMSDQLPLFEVQGEDPHWRSPHRVL